MSALLFIVNLLRTHSNTEIEENTDVEYSVPVHAVVGLSKLLNSFAFWNVVILIYLIASYAYPIGQFFLMDTYGSMPWRI